ncbi:MAG: hypothetical protein LAO06_06475 [Acidobacteriia bacterium]|nr:hypothetical protein [Terriglobia bacterium]
MKPIRVSATCVAEIANSSPATRLVKLRPFKYRDRGEGAGRSAYYKRTIDVAREYHRGANDVRVIRRVIEELTAIENDPGFSRNARTKARRNIDAVVAYDDLYGRRNFRVLSNHRISFTVGRVTITAQPDLWVEENGTVVLIKIGVAKHKTAEYIDLLLHLIRKAAIASGHRIRARNVVYLNTTTGEEIISHLPLSHFNRTIRNACQEISSLWSSVSPPESRPKIVVR